MYMYIHVPQYSTVLGHELSVSGVKGQVTQNVGNLDNAVDCQCTLTQWHGGVWGEGERERERERGREGGRGWKEEKREWVGYLNQAANYKP